MGQKIEDIKAEKKNEGGEKESDASIVLKLDLHCEGCAQKFSRFIGRIPGVEKVKSDCETGKLTIKGDVDPTWLRDRVAIKTKKTVELISSPPKREAAGDKKSGGDGAGDKKSCEKKKKKTEDKKADEKKPKETPVSSVVALKIRVNCDECAHRIKRVIKKIEGVHEVNVELEKNLVTVRGTMDIKKLTPYLIDKLEQNVEVVPSKKDNEGGEKKGKKGDNDKKEKQGGGGDGSSRDKKEKVEVNKKSCKGKEGDNDKKEKQSGGTGGGNCRDNKEKGRVDKKGGRCKEGDNDKKEKQSGGDGGSNRVDKEKGGVNKKDGKGKEGFNDNKEKQSSGGGGGDSSGDKKEKGGVHKKGAVVTVVANNVEIYF